MKGKKSILTILHKVSWMTKDNRRVRRSTSRRTSNVNAIICGHPR